MTNFPHRLENAQPLETAMNDEAKTLVEQVVNETRKIVEEEYVKVMAAMTQSQIETAEKAIKKHTDLIETQAREIERLREALQSVVNACDQGKLAPLGGPCGMTIEAQIRGSVYNRVPAWPVEEARAALGEKQ